MDDEEPLHDRLSEIGFDVPQAVIDAWPDARRLTIDLWVGHAWLYINDTVDWQLEPIPTEIIDFARPTGNFGKVAAPWWHARPDGPC